MIPHRRASEIDVKIGIGSSGTDEAILLNLRFGDNLFGSGLRRHGGGRLGVVGISGVWRPHTIRDPADLLNDVGRGDVLGQLGLGDLEADQIVDLVLPGLVLEIRIQLVYVHAVGLLALDVDHVQLIFTPFFGVRVFIRS